LSREASKSAVPDSAADPVQARKEALGDVLADEVRANQRATDVVDDLLCELFGVNRTDGRVMDLLEQHGRLTAGRLAEASGLTTGAITAVIDRLERVGYVQRVADPDDRRRVLVELTDKARMAAYELMVAPMQAAAEPLFERYSENDIKLLTDFMRTSREIQERHAEWLRAKLRDQDAAVRDPRA
jgi:DNA-binding MarR family transcriptional regulator